jgi:GntR family transcriptional regulator
MKAAATLEIDPNSSVPLHEQVAGAIRRAIADGEAGPGERLPPARDLAAVLGVNPHTVLRALRTLRDEGLLEFRRGRGITVSRDAPRSNELILKAHELVEIGRRLGYRPDEIAEIVGNLAPASR